MTASRLHRPKAVDLQRAMAFITASVRGDEAIELIWADAVEDGRELMLALALTTLAKQPAMMTDVLGDLAHNPSLALIRMSRVTEALAAFDADDPDDEEDESDDDEELPT